MNCLALMFMQVRSASMFVFVLRHGQVILFTLTRHKLGSDKVAMNFVVEGKIFIKI
jgi:hypothetical protein